MVNFKFQIFLRTLVVLFASMLLGACGGGVTGDANNFVIINDQTVLELNQITLTEVNVDRELCVVIYESHELFENTKGTTVLGELTVRPDDDNKTNVVMPLMRESKNNESMFAELHEGACAGDNGVEETSDIVITQDSVSAVHFIVKRTITPHIRVSSQSITKANLFNVSKIVVNQSSWVVVHRYDENIDNKLGEVIGYQLVEYNSIDAGHLNSVEIRLQEGLASSEELIVALYTNHVEVSEEDFIPSEDVLIESALSERVDVEINAIVCDNCIHFSLRNIGDWAYDWDGDVAAKSKISQETRTNEIITLSVGERYVIENHSVAYHPLSLLNTETQEVLLSQRSGLEGTFEDDPAVSWSDNVGVMQFTLTQELADQLSKYQCAVHASMAGNIIIAN